MNEKVIYEDVEELYKENMVKNCVFAINNAAHHENDTFFHWHHALEITLILEGTMNYTVNGSNHTVTKNNLFLINSGDIHRTQNASDTNRIKTLIIVIADSILDYNIHNYKDSYFQLDPESDSYQKIMF